MRRFKQIWPAVSHGLRALIDNCPTSVGAHRHLGVSWFILTMIKDHVIEPWFGSSNHLAVLHGQTEIFVKVAFRSIVNGDVVAAVIDQVDELVISFLPVIFPRRPVHTALIVIKGCVHHLLASVVVKRAVTLFPVLIIIFLLGGALRLILIDEGWSLLLLGLRAILGLLRGLL